MKHQDMKISTQLRLGLGSILVFVVLLGALAWIQIDLLWQQTKRLYDHPFQVRRAIAALETDILAIRGSMTLMLLAKNEQEIADAVEVIETREADALRQFDVLFGRYLGPPGDITTLHDQFLNWRVVREETIRLLRDGKKSEAVARVKPDGVGDVHVNALMGHIQKVDDFSRNKGEQFYQDAQKHKYALIRRLGIVLGAIVLLTMGVGYLLLKNIKDPLHELTSSADRFRQGKLDVRSSYVSANEFGTLATSFNALAETIQREMQSKESAARIADEASEFAESVINTIREPLIALDQDLRVVKVSRSFYDFFKVKPEETIGQHIYDLGNKQWDILKLRELLEDILPQKAAFDNYEVEHDFAAIGRRIMLLNARQIERGIGKERIILLAIEDITERKEIEAGLEKTRKELAVIKKTADEVSEFAESLINTVREPLISLDQDLRVVTVSRSFYDFFKVRPEETVGQLIYDLGNKQWDIPKLRELLETILPEKATFDNYEVEHDFAAIGRRIMLLNARQIKRRMGRERIILLAIEDITERKEIENGLKKAHEELEAFAYSLSHDLRAPLRGIDGWSLALLEDCKDKIDEQGRQYIDLVRSETQIMGRLIDDLLTFSRQSHSEINLRQLDMTAMAQAIISRLQRQNPTLQTDFIIQPGLTALGDAGLIEIALLNLLDNAAKFSSKSSRPVIEFGQVEQEGRKAFFVRDNGVGFDMAYANKLFGVFRRLHKSSEFPGTGIGLASVQRIINRHGGRIWAEAKVNQGATFRFTLKEAT